MRRLSILGLIAASTLGIGLGGCGGDESPSGSGGAGNGGAKTGGSGPTTGGGSPGGGGPGGGGAGGSAPSPYGDRNIGVDEPYPDSVLIQNGGRFYNVKKPPMASLHAAKGDGTTDDTDAFLDAFDYLKALYVAANPSGSPTEGFDGSNDWLYVPDGHYRVTKTLSYRGPTLVTPSFGSDIVRLRIMGGSRENTVIQLDDHAPGFDDSAAPKVLLELQHDGTNFNNAPATNVVANLTLDTGKGNPFAVGLWFQGANLTGMHNVKIQSGDGKGSCGLMFLTGSVQGYYRDITVVGFDSGICQLQNPEFDSALEHVTLTGQNVTGVLVEGGGMSLRKLAVDESKTQAEGLKIDQSGGVVLVDESLFEGSKKIAAIEQTSKTGQALFARNVGTVGYTRAIVQAGETAVAGANVDWFASSPPVTLIAGGTPAKSLGLEVEDAPLSPWFDPKTEWASVDDYGAVGDGSADDLKPIQKAMDSGKPVVVFPRSAYRWSGTITIPASVERVDFMYADAQGGLSIAEASKKPIRLAYHPGYGQVSLGAARPVVLSDWSGSFDNPMSIPTKVYLENVANIGAADHFAPAGQSTWARSLNDEQGGGSMGDVRVAGGSLWMFGYKTENKPVSSIVASAGAKVEVLNGYVNMTEAPGATPMLVNDGATMSFIGFTNLGSAIHGPFQAIIQETQGGSSATLTYDQGFGTKLPARGGTYGADFVVPLYVGGP